MSGAVPLDTVRVCVPSVIHVCPVHGEVCLSVCLGKTCSVSSVKHSLTVKDVSSNCRTSVLPTVAKHSVKRNPLPLSLSFPSFYSFFIGHYFSATFSTEY